MTNTFSPGQFSEAKLLFFCPKSFEREIYNGHLSLDDALEQQIRWKDDIDIYKESTKPQIKEKKKH